ncbi:Zn-ribbon domain-containing OB-fold protein [Marinivivus vitaminiproducens]|uniref:Zn-ribbon domain-containing OB-fold protein n=1 Tax=Marinivivus vitaminiproducens TaxID=3035935 RepID=UPI0027A84D92|nr:OB-fold domain-containing protein [Geminicoccaceae bacterium SCSIO 64248]
MTEAMLSRPEPKHTPVNEPFWRAAAEGRLATPKCEACGERHFPPAPRCPHCLSDRIGWSPVSGRGNLVSWVVFHQCYWDSVREELPYLVATVDLEEGVRLLTNLVGEAGNAPRYGMELEVTFRPLASGEQLPVFKAANDRAS